MKLPYLKEVQWKIPVTTDQFPSTNDIQTLRKTNSANQPHTYLESTDVLQDFGDIALIKLNL